MFSRSVQLKPETKKTLNKNKMQEGISGKIASFFMNSKLTILLMVALMIIGTYSSFLIPREEEPQINVPMADVMIGYPGASPSEVESRVIKPL